MASWVWPVSSEVAFPSLLAADRRYTATHSLIEDDVGREKIDAIVPFSALLSLGQIEQLVRWLLGDTLSWANIAQVPALFLTGAVAWLLCHPVRMHVVAWINRHPDHHRLDWLVLHRPLATERLVPLITPLVWAIGLWISISVAQYGDWPHVTSTSG